MSRAAEGSRGRICDRLADVLGLAAAPCFAALAMLTAASGMSDLCSAGTGWSWLGGMAPMYALMGAFHCGPWLRLLSEDGRELPTSSS